MSNFTSNSLVTFLAALLMCVGNASAGPLAQAQAGNPEAATRLNKGFTRMPLKKSGSGVELAYQFQGTPEIGKPLLIKMTMQSPVDAQVVLRADDGLQLQDAGLVMRSFAGSAAEHQLTVVPKARGRFYLHVMSTAYGRTSASAIAVQVGADKDMPLAKSTGTVKTMPNGERIISMPAQ